MSYQLPKQQFLRDHFITLNEGFDRVGRFMFPQDWTGHEAFASPTDNPQELRDRKARLEADFHRTSQHARMLRTTNTFGMEPEEADELYEQQRRAEADRDTARESLDHFRQPYDARIGDAEAYERRMAVEQRLCEAIKTG